MTDKELFQDYIERNSEESFEELVRRHHKMVSSSCFRVLDDVHLAEDCAQTVFILLHQKAKTLGENVFLPGWLYKTALFTAKNQRRVIMTSKKYEKEAMGFSIIEHDSNLEETWTNIRTHLDDAIADLPSKMRNSLILRYLEGKSRGEAAEILGMPEMTVKTNISRGLTRIRAFFKKKGVATSSATLVFLLSSHSVEGKALSQTASFFIKAVRSPSPSLQNLAKRISKAMFINKITHAFYALATLIAILFLGFYSVNWLLPRSTESMGKACALSAAKKHQRTSSSSCSFPLEDEETQSKTFHDYRIELNSVLSLENDMDRYNGLRRLGLELSFETYMKAVRNYYDNRFPILSGSGALYYIDKDFYMPENTAYKLLKLQASQNLLLFLRIITEWRKNDPSACANWSCGIPAVNSWASNPFLLDCLRFWLIEDPQAVNEYLKSVEISKEDAATIKLFKEILQDPGSVVARTEFCNRKRVFDYWVQFNPEGVLDLLDSLQNKKYLPSILSSSTLERLIRYDLERITAIHSCPTSIRFRFLHYLLISSEKALNKALDLLSEDPSISAVSCLQNIFLHALPEYPEACLELFRMSTSPSSSYSERYFLRALLYLDNPEIYRRLLKVLLNKEDECFDHLRFEISELLRIYKEREMLIARRKGDWSGIYTDLVNFDKATRSKLLNSLVRYFANHCPKELFRLSNQLVDNDLVLYQDAMKAWIAAEPKSAWRYFSGDQIDEKVFVKLFPLFIKNLFIDKLQNLIDRKFTGERKYTFYAQIVIGIAETDLQKALEFIDQYKKCKNPTQPMVASFFKFTELWFSSDPLSVLEWAVQLPDVSLEGYHSDGPVNCRLSVLKRLLHGLAIKEGKDKALKWLNETDDLSRKQKEMLDSQLRRCFKNHNL